MSDLKQRLMAGLRAGANQVLASRPLVLRQSDLQVAAEGSFPVTFQGIVPITLQNPYLRLDRNSDQLGLEVDVSAEITSGNRLISRWLLVGNIIYERGRGEFFLQRPDIRSLDPGSIFEAFNAPGFMRGLVIEDLLGGLAASIPLYRLHPGNPKHALARRWLRSLRVQDGKLLIYIGLSEDHSNEPQG